MHIDIDKDSCIGAGQCALTAPDVFAQDDDGYSTVRPGRSEHVRGGRTAGAAPWCGRRPGRARSAPSACRSGWADTGPRRPPPVQ
jgi:ferredoxin